MEKRPIASVLRAMLPGDKEIFPIIQQPSVVSTYQNRMIKEKLEGWSFSYSNKLDEGITIITRNK